jgi:hypothetical protein
VLGSAAAAHPRAMVHGGFLSLYTSSNASSKYNKLSARDQASGSMSMTQFLPSLLLRRNHRFFEVCLVSFLNQILCQKSKILTKQI